MLTKPMLTKLGAAGLYGAPPPDLAPRQADAAQFSPLVPGSAALEDAAEASMPGMIMLAPPGTVERRYSLALALRTLVPGATLVALAPKDKGGSRIAKELRSFGCTVTESVKSHNRICMGVRPAVLTGIDAAIGAGGPQRVEAIGLWSQPGIFSWDRIDPGSALLAELIKPLAGRGADFGCGFGFLANKSLSSPAIQELVLIDVDRRAIAAAQRNVTDPRARFVWDDLRKSDTVPGSLDFVVMNPPFHDGGQEDKALGQIFIKRASEVLRPGGVCWLTANRHLPYEAALAAHFSSATLRADRDGYKVYEAKR